MLVDQFNTTLDAIGARLENEPLTEAMEECHGHVVDGIRDCFAEGISPDGEIWPARKGKATHPLLNLSGELYAAATGGSGHIKLIGYREMVTGVEKRESGSLAGAAVHQYGATIYPKTRKFLSFIIDGVRYFARKVTIPARPYIGATSEAIDNCRETISEAVNARVFRR